MFLCFVRCVWCSGVLPCREAQPCVSPSSNTARHPRGAQTSGEGAVSRCETGRVLPRVPYLEAHPSYSMYVSDWLVQLYNLYRRWTYVWRCCSSRSCRSARWRCSSSRAKATTWFCKLSTRANLTLRKLLWNCWDAPYLWHGPILWRHGKTSFHLSNFCFYKLVTLPFIIITVFCQRQVFHCKLRHQGCSSAQRQVFHCKLRHQGCSSAQRQVFHCKLRNQACSFTRNG